MSLSFQRKVKLADERGDGQRPYLNHDGAFLGEGVALLEQGDRGLWRPRNDLEALLDVGYGGELDAGRSIAVLGASSKVSWIVSSIAIELYWFGSPTAGRWRLTGTRQVIRPIKSSLKASKCFRLRLMRYSPTSVVSHAMYFAPAVEFASRRLGSSGQCQK